MSSTEIDFSKANEGTVLELYFSDYGKASFMVVKSFVLADEVTKEDVSKVSGCKTPYDYTNFIVECLLSKQLIKPISLLH